MNTAIACFRAASGSDIPAIVSLVGSTCRGDASRSGWAAEADLLDGPRVDADLLRQDLQHPSSQVLPAESAAGELLARAPVAIDDGAEYFGMSAVRPKLQGSGRQVIVEAGRIARDDWRQTRMRMTVIDIGDGLIAHRERCGYRCTGMGKPFPYGAARFGIPLREGIRFQVLEQPLPQSLCAA